MAPARWPERPGGRIPVSSAGGAARQRSNTRGLVIPPRVAAVRSTRRTVSRRRRPTSRGSARLVGRLRRLTVRRVLRTAATRGGITSPLVLLRCRAAPPPDDTGIRPPGRSGHLAGAIGTGGGPAGSDLRPTPSGHPPRDPHPGLTLKAVLDEAVLRRSAAPPTSPDGDTIMLGQLDRLTTVGGWPDVTHPGAALHRRHPTGQCRLTLRAGIPRHRRPRRRLPRETEPESSSSTQHLRSTGTQGISSCSPRSPYRGTNPPNSSIPSRTNSGTTPPPVHSETEIHHSPGGGSLGCITG